jgi:hypothetical protein
MIMFGGLKFQPALYVSFFALILIHEIGHALIVKAYAFENHELIVHGLGGACIWSGSATQKQIIKIFKENSGEPRQRRQRRPFPRR